MKKIGTLLIVLLFNVVAYGQSITRNDMVEFSLCPDFKCFEKTATLKGISMVEKPYDDAFGGKHQVVFNAKYESVNIDVYSVGLTFKDNNTTVFVRSKNKDYSTNLLADLLQWGSFEITGKDLKDGTTAYSTYTSKHISDLKLRVEVYYDNDDKTYYYVTKMTRPSRKADVSQLEKEENRGTFEEPAVEVKNKSYSMRVYSSWAPMFLASDNANSTDEIWCRGKETDRKVFFQGAPDSWLKVSQNSIAFFVPRIAFNFYEKESTIAKERQELIQFNEKRSGEPLSKINYTEKEVTLEDGHKATMFFYNTPIPMGDVNGIDCEIVMVSKENPKMIIIYSMGFESGDYSVNEMPAADVNKWADFFAAMLLTVKKL